MPAYSIVGRPMWCVCYNHLTTIARGVESMTTTESKASTLESLDIAQREFEAGNYIESSRILWQATQATYRMLAEAHGLNSSNLSAIARALDKKYNSRYHYLGYLISGRLLRDHAAMDVLEYGDLEYPHEDLPPFIRKCYRQFAPDDASQ